MFSAFIFDLDGVVVDTAKFHFLAWEEIAQKLDIEFKIEDNERLKGVSRVDSLKIILEIGKKKIDTDSFEKLLTEKNEIYLNHISTLSKNDILPGVHQLLGEIKEKGHKIALGSASKNAKFILEKLSLTSFFDAIVDGTTVKTAKPDPEVFLSAASLLGDEPSSCIVFEDAQSGVAAAKSADMACIGIGEKSQLFKADFVFSGFKDLSLNQIQALFRK